MKTRLLAGMIREILKFNRAVFSSEDEAEGLTVSDREEDSFPECPYVDMGAKRKKKSTRKVRFALDEEADSSPVDSLSDALALAAPSTSSPTASRNSSSLASNSANLSATAPNVLPAVPQSDIERFVASLPAPPRQTKLLAYFPTVKK